MTTSRVLEGITRTSLYLILLSLPVFFLPLTPDFLEFNKQYLLYALTTVGLLAWLVRGIAERKFTIARTAVDLPLAAFWIVILLSSIFSKDRTLSFFGSYERLTEGFVPFTSYLIFFYLFVTHLRGRARLQRVLLFLAGGGALAALYFWFYVSGALPHVPPVTPWNPASAANARFGIILLTPLLVGLMRLLDRDLSRRAAWFWGALTALAGITILSLGFKSVMVAGAIAVAWLLIVTIAHLRSVRLPAAAAAMALFVMFLVFAIFGNFRALTVPSLPVEVSLAQGISWQIALATAKEGLGRALLGSGPATFGYDFSAHRPEMFNANMLWATRFSTASAQGAELLASIGALGTLTFLFVVIASAWTILRSEAPTRSVRGRRSSDRNSALRDQESVNAAVTAPPQALTHALFPGSAALWIASVTFVFLTPFGSVLWVYFFASLAFLLAANQGADRERLATLAFGNNNPQRALVFSFLSIAVITVVVVCSLYLGRYYVGEVQFRSGLLASVRRDVDTAIIKVTSASILNPNEQRYPLTLAQLQFQRAIRESRESSPDANRMGRLMSAAVANARRATELAPNSAAAWQVLGDVYAQVIPLAQDAIGWARDAYTRAIVLESTNPMLYIARGNILLREKRTQEATQDYEEAIRLKRDYAPAHAARAALLEEQNDLGAAIAAQEEAVKFGRGNADLAYNLARLYVNRNKGEDAKNAEAILTKLLERNPDHANARFTLGSLYERLGRRSVALEQFKQLSERIPDHPNVRQKIKELSSPPQ